MYLQAAARTLSPDTYFSEAALEAPSDRKWYAVFTTPQHEKSVVRHLDIREVESFLPTYETFHVWKNRQRMRVVLPLFPTYLFVHITANERRKVLASPGVIQLVGNGRESIALPAAEIDSLRSALSTRKILPFRDLVLGTRVRVREGIMRGVEGTLVRKANGLRFVLSLNLINQHAAVEVDAEILEPIVS